MNLYLNLLFYLFILIIFMSECNPEERKYWKVSKCEFNIVIALHEYYSSHKWHKTRVTRVHQKKYFILMTGLPLALQFSIRDELFYGKGNTSLMRKKIGSIKTVFLKNSWITWALYSNKKQDSIKFMSISHKRLTLSLSLSLTHSLTHSLSHSIIFSLSNVMLVL